MIASAARSIMRLIGRVAGVGGPSEHALFDVRNDAAVAHETIKTVHLLPSVDEETQRIVFSLPPKYDGNLFAFLLSSFDRADGERIIITEVARLHYTNELGYPLHFVVERIFDPEEAIDAIRNTVDKAVAGGGGGSTSAPSAATGAGNSKILPPRLATERGRVKKVSAIRKDKEEIPVATAVETDARGSETDREDDAASRLMRLSAHTGGGGLQEEDMQNLLGVDDVTVRGQSACRNQTERKNELSLDVLEADRTVWSDKPRILYRASVSNEIITWFAGQDGAVMLTPSQITAVQNTRANQTAEERAAHPVVRLAIFPSDHTLVMFIRMFQTDLDVADGEMSQFYGDRGESGPTFWSIDLALIERARKMILYVVYAQMYYTTMKSAQLTRRVASYEEDAALLPAIAARWELPFDALTKRYMDWPQGAYRPVVSITLRVKFYVVSRVESTAALLQRQATHLKKK